MKKIVLIGDSIRMGYLPFVKKKMEGTAEVWGPATNCRHSLWALDHFPSWVAEQEPDIVHVNFGIHDASVMADGEHQIILEQYRLCLRRFIAKVNAMEKVPQMIWATITPLYISEEGVPMSDWRVHAKAEIDVYNAAALEIAKEAGLPVNDLHAAVMDNDYTKCLTPDGCHMTETGNNVLSDAVVTAVTPYL